MILVVDSAQVQRLDRRPRDPGRDGVLRKFTLTSLELSQAVYPRAHTCFNRIDVPLYRTKEELVAGFEFVLELGDQTFTMD